MATAMTHATINGENSVYLTPVTPVPIIKSVCDSLSDAVKIATEMVAETEKPVDEWTDEDFLNDPETQAELNAWYEEREAESDALCDAHDADAHKLASLGDGALRAIAGHDEVWQAGDQV